MSGPQKHNEYEKLPEVLREMSPGLDRNVNASSSFLIVEQDCNEVGCDSSDYVDQARRLQKPRLLDLCCGAGGASVGYMLAGFKVDGVDIDGQRDYPFKYRKMDVLHLTYEDLEPYDAIHASVPCEGYCTANVAARTGRIEYPDLYHPVKAMLIASGKPYIMENVIGSPIKGFRLCGTQFGLGVFRHRVFECNFPIEMTLAHCTCRQKRIDGKDYITVAGSHAFKHAWKHLNTPWIKDTHKIKKVIPPAYTEWIGIQLMAWLTQNMRSAA